mmetsp:Transcript_46726/g.47187  ORF Transcript_46726/g.47187 Transcript_46726/m.47187 type:complete len:216 (-) Transcript_46726:183-830(-)
MVKVGFGRMFFSASRVRLTDSLSLPALVTSLRTVSAAVVLTTPIRTRRSSQASIPRLVSFQPQSLAAASLSLSLSLPLLLVRLELPSLDPSCRNFVAYRRPTERYPRQQHSSRTDHISSSDGTIVVDLEPEPPFASRHSSSASTWRAKTFFRNRSDAATWKIGRDRAIAHSSAASGKRDSRRRQNAALERHARTNRSCSGQWSVRWVVMGSVGCS